MKLYIYIACVLFFVECCNLAPGSYPYAEKYLVNMREDSLIERVQIFKKENPEFIVPQNIMLQDGRRNNEDHWYHIYFYYKPENQIVKTWVRSSRNGGTVFAFVGINEGLTIGNWKEINKDFKGAANLMQKQMFEKRILNKIKQPL